MSTGAVADSGRDPEKFGAVSPTAIAQADAAGRDEAIAIVGEQEHELDPVIVARAVRKIDLFLMPAMVVGCKSIF